MAIYFLPSPYFKVSPEEVLGDRGEYRKIAIHLMKKWTSIPNKQIGELFGALSYYAVSKVQQRFSRKIEKDRALRSRVKKILDNVSRG